jgi:hypothetical protein
VQGARVVNRTWKKNDAKVYRTISLQRFLTFSDDFRFVQAEHMIHVLNAPSPAATASLSIGQLIADMTSRQWGLTPIASVVS